MRTCLSDFEKKKSPSAYQMQHQTVGGLDVFKAEPALLDSPAECQDGNVNCSRDGHGERHIGRDSTGLCHKSQSFVHPSAIMMTTKDPLWKI